jgi:hypothetical protein
MLKEQLASIGADHQPQIFQPRHTPRKRSRCAPSSPALEQMVSFLGIAAFPRDLWARILHYKLLYKPYNGGQKRADEARHPRPGQGMLRLAQSIQVPVLILHLGRQIDGAAAFAGTGSPAKAETPPEHASR